METRRGSTWLTNRTESSSTTRARRFATTKSRRCWTTSALDRIGSETLQYRERFEDSRAAQSAAGPQIDRRRRREEELQREVRRLDNDRAKIQTLLSGNRTNLESHEPRTSERLQLIREFRSEVTQLKASAVPPDLTRDLETKIESQKTEIQRATVNTESLNSWDEVNLKSIQGVQVDESVGTSTSSVSRIT